ncbi:MAG TPA: 1-acyl-sn-glycerol-3-phosphate acyltransferase [Bacteroidales bacterium]|nr:1-acyl-sn-glycerol-3-phosphate acyltransferase [Bacteroidales bacterium]
MENNNEKELKVDVEAVIRSKNPKLLKVLPKFLISYVKRIIHQDELNQIIYNLKDLYDLDYVNQGLKELGAEYTVAGLENIPAEGRFIFAGNHPLGGLDGLVLMSAVGRKFKNVKFVVNDLLMYLKNMSGIFVPVNKHGRQTADYARKIDDTYNSDAQILYFPAGLCSRKIKGQIIDLEWQRNFIAKAIEYKRDIIPFYFEARNTNFFYNLANIRKKLRIKANIEMVYLVDEMFKQRHKKIHLTFGKPIPYTILDSSKTKKEWADYVRKVAYGIKEKISEQHY